MRRALLGFALVSLACGSPTGPTKEVPLGQEFSLRPGETAVIGDELLALTFDGVLSDSRCPADVTCIWEGDAVVRVTARRLPRTEARLELHTRGDGSEAGFQGYRVRLVALRPQPRSERPIPAMEYEATLVVRRP